MAENTPRMRRYEGFPSFTEWADAGAQLTAWDKAREQWPVPSTVLPPVLNNALRIIRRSAAIDTGAIEALYGVDRGFTLTVAMQGVLCEATLATKPEKARSLIQAQLEAYDRLLDIINGPWPITEAVVRELHLEICKNQETYLVETSAGRQEQILPKGEYKQQPNNVLTIDGSLFKYCPPERVSSEMHVLVDTLRSEEFSTAHPVLQSSWSHHAFVLIHPFADGNGRVARLLASLFFVRPQQSLF